ncbi:MAG: ABC transporter permease [Vicinamibacteria bacterium]|nr:ABC transporter permease [Vicinamibacteria bacterium]
MSGLPQPPYFAIEWLKASVPRHLLESVIGDLEEEWRRRAITSPRLATLWYCRHAAAVAVRLGWFDLVHKQPRRDGHPARQGDGLMETLWNDARYGARMLSRTPGFTFVAVLTLALGIGANTAIFSVVNALLIKPLPLPDSERLVSVSGVDAKGRSQFVSFPDFEDLQKQSRLFEGFTAMVPQSVNLTGGSEPQRVRGGFVSDNFFGLVGVDPEQGRGFRAGDDDLAAEPVCVLQHEAWQNVFSGDPKIVGKAIVLNNAPFTVVGVLPRGFRFPFDDVEVWMPHHTWPVFKTADNYLNRANGLVGPVGKLKPAVTMAEGQAELDTIAARVAQEYPAAGAGRKMRARPLRDVVVQNARPMVLVLMGAVAFVLLIACANVANLMLARASARQTEIATRAALGAGRGRLIKQMLTETALLWVGGGILGTILGYFGLGALLASSPGPLPGGVMPALDWTVLAFTFALSAGTGVVFGAFAALRFSRPDLSGTLKEGGRSGEGAARSRLGSALVVAQVALTLVMLVGSGLMLRSFQKLTQVEVGFKTDNLLTLEYRLPANKYPDGAQQWEVHRQIVERVRAVPGVTSASVVRAVPFGGNGSNVLFEIPGTPPPADGDAPRALINFGDQYYFETMGIPLLRGRNLNDLDGPTTTPVIVINRRMAERYWPNQNPLGRAITFPDPKNPITATIVGVVGDVKHYGLDDPDGLQAYAYQAQQPYIFNSLVVRTAGDPMAMTSAVRTAVWSVDPEQPMWKIYTMDFMVDRSLGQTRFMMGLMTAYSALALLLAAVGLYGVMAYSVSQRAREIGVRMALGAQSRDVLRLVLGRGLRLTLAGLLLGLGASLALGSSVRSLLYGVQAGDPATLIGAALVLFAVALLASYVPARKATTANPVTILHRT